MSDTLITVVAIVLAVGTIFMFPLISTADRKDDISQQAITSITTEFVEEVCSTGKITQDNWDSFISSLNSQTGNNFEPEIEVQILDENVGKKVSQADMTKIGENYYYSIYTSQVLEDMATSGVKKLKQGDRIIVKVQNTSKTMFQTLTGSNTPNLLSQDSGTVAVDAR